MEIREQIVAAIDAFQAKTGMSDYALSIAATGKHNTAVARIRAGEASLRTIEAVERYIKG